MDGHTGDWGIEQYKKGTTAEQPDPGEDADYPSRGGLAGVKLLYSTMAPHFSLPQFLETFLLNLTLPLPYPYFFWKYGWGFLFSMQLSPFRKFGLLGCVAQAVFYITIVSASIAPEGYYWRLPSVLFLVVLHRCMIGLKYSSLSHEEYSLFMGVPEGSEDEKYNYPTPEEQETLELFQQQLQLTSGWMRISDDRLDYELTTAGESCNINMHSCFFKVPGPELGFMHNLQYKRWLHFLQLDDLGSKGKDGFYRVSAYQVCKSIFRLAEHSCVSARSAVRAIPILAILNTSIGVFFSNQDFSKISTMGIVFNISSSMVSIFYFSVLEVIMFIAFLDFLRRYNYAVLLSRLARVIDAETRIRISVSKKPKHSARNLNISTRKLGGISCDKIEVRGDSGRHLNDYTLKPTNCAKGMASEEIILKSLEDEEHNVDPDDKIMPKVDMLIPSNYIIWLNCKQIFLRFGKRTEFRLLVYIGILFILALLLLFILSFQMGITNDPVGLINSSYFVQSVVYILILGVQQSIIIFVGGMANTKNLQHKNLMTAHVIHLHSKTDNAGQACLAQLQDCMAKAEAVKDSCEAISEAKPLKVLGVECTKEWAIGLVSSVVLYILAIVQYAITEGTQDD